MYNVYTIEELYELTDAEHVVTVCDFINENKCFNWCLLRYMFM